MESRVKLGAKKTENIRNKMDDEGHHDKQCRQEEEEKFSRQMISFHIKF